MDTNRTRIVIMGAAGRDFHDFNVVFRSDPSYHVVAFTATQIPNIESRLYPPELAGPHYPDGIPIRPEADLEALVAEHRVEQAVLSYSDLNHQTVMHIASRVLAAGADFRLLGLEHSQLRSSKPVVAVCAVRTGCGKSQTSRYVARVLRAAGKKVVAIRHPMPYRDLSAQRVQRFADRADLDAAGDLVTIEEREEYEPHVANDTVVHAGVDYEAILAAAEAEADVIIWDGGNNDIPFVRPDLWLTVADPHRAGHETGYHPGEVNFRKADVVVINKADTADKGAIDAIRAAAAQLNPDAAVVVHDSTVTADDPEAIRDKRVLLIEDGPTLTHGEMPFGAGQVAADRYGARCVVDPRPAAQGSLAEVFARYRHMGKLLPAMGYYPEQVRELEETVRAVDCDSVVIATPIDLRRLIEFDRPATRVRYELADREPPTLAEAMAGFVGRL